jgi:outer membrane receptor protein involved in Fe transport
VPPVLPAPVDGYISVGNPNATAERATSYDVGYEHRFIVHDLEFHLGSDLYRTDLHNGVATYFPATQCQAGVNYGANPPCLSYPVNVTQEVYQGLEVHGDLAFTRHDTLRVGYDVDSVYTQSVPAASSDDAVPYEQALGVPLHKLTVNFEHDTGAGLAYYAGMLYEGAYNETNLAPYATLRAGATWHMAHFDVGIYGTNLTDVYDFKQQRVGAGVPYGGLTDIVPTNAIPLAPRTITFSIAHKM